MMNLLVIDYLKTHTFQQLETEHGVNARPSKCFSKFSLNYDMLDAQAGAEISGQCRGLIIRPKSVIGQQTWKDVLVGDCDIIAYPLHRFYNHGDYNCAKLNWQDVTIYEKIDGTMIALYHDSLQGRWCVATRSVPEADIPMSMHEITFSDLFWMALEKTVTVPIEHLLGRLQKNVTYVFELTSPLNQVVIPYNEYRVTLLASRDNKTGIEMHLDRHVALNLPFPKQWKLSSVEDIVKFVDAANPLELEGAVVCDAGFNRIKIKNKSYVLAHATKDSVCASPRNAMEIVLRKKVDDITPLLDPLTAQKMIEMQDNVKKYLEKINVNFKIWKDLSQSRKDFALKVISSKEWNAPYFAMWENKATSSSNYIEILVESNKLTPTTIDNVLFAVNAI